MKNAIRIDAEWGDCDPAQIALNANFFRWFDKGTRHLLDAAGISFLDLQKRYDLIGIPLVNATADFRSPVRFGNTMDLESEIAKLGRSSLTIEHRIHVGGRI